ncbi:transposable element Tcb1 transposase [Trichonephila clavipes]|nr:transposable element Tcb1 transposase [Trichonephila clavipes]
MRCYTAGRFCFQLGKQTSCKDTVDPQLCSDQSTAFMICSTTTKVPEPSLRTSFKNSPCSYSCVCDGQSTYYEEKNFKRCGTDKRCYQGDCMDEVYDNCKYIYGSNFIGLLNPRNPCSYNCFDTHDPCKVYEEYFPQEYRCYTYSNTLGQCYDGRCITGTAIRGFSSGRPQGTSPADDRYIVLQARRNRQQTAGEIARHTTQATGRPISRFTVARRLHGGGLFARRPVRCVPLTPAQRRRRSLWCGNTGIGETMNGDEYSLQMRADSV